MISVIVVRITISVVVVRITISVVIVWIRNTIIIWISIEVSVVVSIILNKINETLFRIDKHQKDPNSNHQNSTYNGIIVTISITIRAFLFTNIIIIIWARLCVIPIIIMIIYISIVIS